MPRVDDITLNEFLKNHKDLPIVSEIITELLELRLFKESMEPILEWREGKGGSWILTLNEVGVGHVIPVPQDDWSWNASLEPLVGLPYQLEGRSQHERRSLEMARVECEKYVRDHLVRTQVTCRKDHQSP
jgi:hypothetical protein